MSKRTYASIAAEERDRRESGRRQQDSREKELARRNREEALAEPVASRPAPAWLKARNRARRGLPVDSVAPEAASPVSGPLNTSEP